MTSAVEMFAGGLVWEHMQRTAELRSQWAQIKSGGSFSQED